MGRLALLALLVVLGDRTASAQVTPTTGSPPQAGRVEKSVQRLVPPLNFDRLGYAEGLPNSNVRAIVLLRCAP